jgi:hypothetical protein
MARINAKDEFINHVGRKIVKCAFVQFIEYEDGEKFFITTGYTQDEYNEFISVESDKYIEELEEDIYEQIEDWSRLARFHPENESFPGEYVKGSYSYELDYQGDDGDEIDVYVEESDNE